MISPDVEVAIVGGGPAGAVTATLLASAGHDVMVLERTPAYRWRACGVFTSPAAIGALRSVGLTDAEIALVARPIHAMRVETWAGTTFELTYGGEATAAGLDRATLDPLLLARAEAAGARVLRGTPVAAAALDEETGEPSLTAADGRTIRARVVVGADGLRSVVAAAVGVGRRSPLGLRVGLTFHVPESAPGSQARMVLVEEGYCGLAPVPGGRVNVGIVLERRWLETLRRDGSQRVARRVLGGVLARSAAPRAARDEDAAATLPILDGVAGAVPLGGRVTRRAGRDWVLVGDAAGFLDPFSGEGLHRALVSAVLAAEVVSGTLRGSPTRDLSRYDRAMHQRFASKDVVSRLVQAFLSRPALFEYAARRLAARSGVRETMGLVIGDLVPARRALDPRYLAALLSP